MDALILDRAFVLTGAASRDRSLAGGKAAVLAELAEALPVPPFFVLTPAAFDTHGLRWDAAPALQAALAELGSGLFAVRSSGVEEDGAEAAHAGQFETRLNVPAPQIHEAALAVWRSGFSPDLAAYRRARGLDDAPQPPAVIVQRMLDPEAAGVAFTADPVTGDRETTVITAVAGLADRLVSGEVDGQTFRVSRNGEVLERPEDDAVLGDDRARAVAGLARRAEAHYGAPQDVEWAIEDGRVFLLQSRPITTLPQAASPIVARPDPTLSVWDNSNIVESYPGVVSPLTFSFARDVYGHVYRAFAALLGVGPAVIRAERPAFDTLLGRVHGRVYYNLLAWYRLLSLLPGFKANRAFMEGMMGVAEALPPELARSIAPPATSRRALWADRARMARVGLGLVWRAAVLPRDIRRFYDRLNAALARSDAEIEALPLSALAGEYRRLEEQLLERWDAPLVNDLLCMIAFGASRKVTEKWAGAEGLALHGEVMIGQGDIVSAEPARRIREMGTQVRARPDLAARLAAGDAAAVPEDAALHAAWSAYLAKFGDRCTEELKLESPTLHDDPSPLLAAVSAASRAEAAGAPQARGDPEAALHALFRGRPVRRAVAGRLLRWAKARVRDRENLRFERTRLFGRVRRIVRTGGRELAAAGHLQHGDDVFLLTIQEWLGAVEGGGVTRDLQGLVALRRREDEADRRRPDPPERFDVRGAFLPGTAEIAEPARTAGEAGELRRGQACCAGVVTARVRVVADPRREALEPGEILVARHTDPGWIAVFANAGGVIAERGSLLSHSAIVAREMGVPCVVALKDATGWLRTGDRVRLDGGAGTVERLPSETPA